MITVDWDLPLITVVGNRVTTNTTVIRGGTITVLDTTRDITTAAILTMIDVTIKVSLTIPTGTVETDTIHITTEALDTDDAVSVHLSSFIGS